MYMFWWGLLVGIIIMSASSVYALAVFDDGKEEWTYFFAVPIMWIMASFWGIYKFGHFVIKRRSCKSLVVCPDNQIRYINSSDVDNLFETKRGYSFASFDKYAEREGWNISDWCEDNVVCGVGSARYAPKKVWKRYEKLC